MKIIREIKEMEKLYSGNIKELLYKARLLIESQENEIKSMRCCGNCQHSLTMSQMGLIDIRPCKDCVNDSKWEMRLNE